MDGGNHDRVGARRGHQAAMTRALIDEHRGSRTYAALSRQCGEAPRWLSDVLTHRHPRCGQLPRMDQINRLAGVLRIPSARLLLTLAADSGLDDADITPATIAMGSAFRTLPPERQAMAIAAVEALAKFETLKDHGAGYPHTG